MPWNGRLIEAAIREADADGDVSALVGSPLTLDYRTPLGWRQHSPHLLIVRNAVPWLITCHWEVTAAKKDGVCAQIGTGCSSIGMGFEVLTERHLERLPRRKNVEAIWRGRFEETPPAPLIRQCLSEVQRRPVTISDLASAVPGMQPVLVYRLILDRTLSVDLDADLANTTLQPGPASSDL